MDCSVYDDLINLTESQINNLKMKAIRKYNNTHLLAEQVVPAIMNSEFADEYSSLQSKYDSYIQQKTNCESNNSNTNYNNYQSSNSNNKSLNQLCKEDFWSYAIAVWDECGCRDWYWRNSPNMNYCIEIEKSCKARYWNYAIATWNECSCKDWYTRNEEETDCIKLTETKWDELCKEKFWNNSIVTEENYSQCTCKEWYIINEKQTKCVINTTEQKQLNCTTRYGKHAFNSEELNACICKEWYVFNEDQTQCVKETSEQRNLNCPARYWSKAIYSEDDNWCTCSDWYIRNEEETQCTKDTKEQREKNCKARYSPIAFLWDDWKSCECPEWYIADSDNPNYCLIDLSEKSLQSRIINTNDAKCDTTQIISNCSKDPTWDNCPAVCLELYDAINWMYDNELTIYNQPWEFWIYNKITREQASKFFVNFYKTLFNKTLITNPQNPFKDINNADPTLYNYILNANILGLFKWTNWKFMPFNHLTKAQSIAVIIRMATWLLDESQNPRYSNYIQRAQSINLLNNISYSYNTLDSEDITRWDIALMLYRLYEYLK